MATEYPQDVKTTDEYQTNLAGDEVSSDRHPVLDDPELDGLTLFEKKAHLINRELDSHGMGRYQWAIWLLCGFGYFLDLLWAQAFGLILQPLEAELGFSSAESGNLSTSFGAGLCAGAFVWGVLVDIVGRWWAFNLTCLFTAIFGLVLGAPSTYSAILVLAAFTGLGVGGNIPIDTTICLEFIPQKRRFLLALLSLFQPVGVIVCSGIAYGFIPKYGCLSDSPGKFLPTCGTQPAGQPCCTRDSNMGWRYTTYTLGAISLLIFFARTVFFRFQESPKFLISKGNDAKAIKVLEYIARYNKTQCHLTLEMFDALTNEAASLSAASGTALIGAGTKQAAKSWWSKTKTEFVRLEFLFSGVKMSIFTILIWVTYITDYFAFTVAGTFLPTILLDKGAAAANPISISTTYRNYIIIYTPGIVGVILGALMYGIPLIGRKWGMVISAALMSVSLFVYSTVDTEASNIGLNLMEYFFQSMFNAILYGFTPEVFPAPVRGTASGVASFWGRLFGIVAPLAAAHLLPPTGTTDPSADNNVLYLGGGMMLAAMVTVLLMPTSYMGAESY